MNTAERVAHFLRKQAGQYFCDDCIVQELRLSKPVARMTDEIGKGSNMRGSANRREVAICSRYKVIRPEAWTLQEFEGDQLLTQPPIGAQLWIEAMGGPIHDLAQIRDIDTFASNLLAAQRTIGNPHRGVGAFGQITRVTGTECTTRIFERYADEIGEVMVPLAFDWKARRAERAQAIPEGLSRLQRERMAKKARKGTLRAV
jgi:hypothetical protein